MGKRRSIFMKLLLSYSVIIIVSFLIFIVFFIYLFHNNLYSERENIYNHRVQQVEAQIENQKRFGWSEAEMEESLQGLLDQTDYHIHILDGDGSEIYGPDSAVAAAADIPDAVIDEVAAEGERITDSGTHEGRLRYIVSAPLDADIDDATNPMMVMVFNDLTHEYQEVALMILFTILVTFVIVGVILWFMSKRITAPLNDINDIAMEYAKGDFSKSVEYEANDEIGQLAGTFNHMADALHHLEERRREFIANLSHDLRSPLTSIKGFLIALSDGTIPENRRTYYYDLMKDETERMITLVNDTLDLTQLEESRIRIDPVEYDLAEQVRRIVRKSAPLYEKKGLSIQVDADSGEMNVHADRDRIEQVLNNLLHNAIQFSPEEGQIEIRIHRFADRVYCDVTDYGKGISESDVNMIWKRYYKVDAARSNRSGAGIGLAIVKSIIELHGSDVTVKSTEGVGTTFSFSLDRGRL